MGRSLFFLISFINLKTKKFPDFIENNTIGWPESNNIRWIHPNIA